MRGVPRRTALLLLVLLGAAMVGLSLVPGWLIHDRVVLGEGPRDLLAHFSAWQNQSLPVLGAAVVVEALVAAGALILLARRVSVSGPALLLGAAGGLGLILASAWPVSQEGHASSVAISAGWPLGVGIVMAAGMLAAALLAGPISRTGLLAAGAVVVVAAVGGAGVRQVGLNLAEGTGHHWSEGTYTRAAIDGAATEQLTLRSGRYSVGDRWSGTFEASGNVVILTGDPACPDARGSYHVQAAGSNGEIRWERIVDLCAGGERARDLQAGTWQRNP